MFLNPFHHNHKADALTELVFEHRNKNYGAYTLRRDYDHHVNKALGITIGSVVLLFLLALLFRNTVEPIIIKETPPDDPSTLGQKFKIETEQKTQTTHIIPAQNNPDSKIYQLVDTTYKDPPPQDTTHPLVASITGTAHTGDDSSNTHGTGNTGPGTGTTPGIPEGGTTTDINKVVIWAEKMPEFPGGINALYKYLSHNINCRGRWLEQGENGQIVFSLVVDRYGKVTDVKVEKDDVHFDCAEQAIEVIKNMPKWSPGMQNSIPVNVKFMFRLPTKKIEFKSILFVNNDVDMVKGKQKHTKKHYSLNKLLLRFNYTKSPR